MANLDRIFQALSDPARRAVLDRPRAGPQPAGRLAEPFGMALPDPARRAVLEQAGLVVTGKTGRVRLCRLADAGLTPVEGWLADQRAARKGRAPGNLREWLRNGRRHDEINDDR